MKKLVVIFILFIFSSCSEKENDTKEELFNATVIGAGLDCGNSYLIKFNSGVSGLPQNSFDNIFYEINLPETYKVVGKQIFVEFRLPENNELMLCTTLGLAYPQLYITKVESHNGGL